MKVRNSENLGQEEESECLKCLKMREKGTKTLLVHLFQKN